MIVSLIEKKKMREKSKLLFAETYMGFWRPRS